jgi:hypothetical protein
MSIYVGSVAHLMITTVRTFYQSFPSIRETKIIMAVIMRWPLALIFLVLSSILSIVKASNSTAFTPEAMLSAPRRGTALPNPAGTLAIYTVSTYSFTKHKTSHELRVLDLHTKNTWLFSNSSDISNAIWLGDGNKIAWLVSEDDGSTSFAIGDVTLPSVE